MRKARALLSHIALQLPAAENIYFVYCLLARNTLFECVDGSLTYASI